MGGNPMMEGILADGGWKNRMKRDESFASVRTAMDDNPWQSPLNRYLQGPFHEERQEPNQGWSLWNKPGNQLSPEEMEILRNEDPRRFQQQYGQLGAVQKAQNFQIGDEPGHSEEWSGPPVPTPTGWQMGSMGRGLIDHNNSMHSWPEEGMLHQQYAEKHGLQPQFMFGIDPEGNVQHHYGEPTPEQLQLLQQHGFKPPKDQYADEDWDDFDMPHESSRDKMYLPWSHNTAGIEDDFDVVQVVPDGPHTEVSSEGIIMQHDDPQVLEEAQNKLAGILPTLLGAGAKAGLMAVAPEVGIPAQIGATLAGHMVGQAMQGGGGEGSLGNSPGDAPGVQAPGDPNVYSSIHSEFKAAYDHPSVNQGYDDTDDPEKVDQNETNDGSHDHWQKDKDVNGTGGTDGFPVESEVGQAFVNALPALMEFYDSPESGAEHPDIKHLAELLDAHHPGMIGMEPTDEDMSDIQEAKGHHHIAMGVPGIGGMQVGSPGTPTPVAQQNAINPMSQVSCPHCGAMVTPGQGTCPQCGAAVTPNTTDPSVGTSVVPQPPAGPMPPSLTNMPVMANKTSGNQGPHNPEQFQAVKNYLQQNIQDPTELATQLNALIDNPDQFGDILSEIQGRGQPPQPDPDQTLPPPMPPQDPSQMGQDPNAAGMPAPQMGMQARQGAADSITPKCPKCGSHTTGLMSDDGLCQCSNCNHKWHSEMESQIDSPIQTKAGHEDLWKTADGQPLQIGQSYEMYTAQTDIPDVIKVTAIRPELIDYTLTGTYGLEHRTELTRREAQLDGATFSTTDQDVQNNDPQETAPNEYGPGDQMSAIASTNFLASLTDEDWEEPSPYHEANLRLAGKKYTPMEQREFIDEPGVARNADKLDLHGTHYEGRLSLLDDDFFLFGL